MVQDRDGEGDGVAVKLEEGRQHLWAQCPGRREEGLGRARLTAPVLGLLQSWPSLGFKSCSDHTEGMGVGEGSLDKLAHTRQMFAQKNTVKSSCKDNRGLLAHAPSLSACLLFSGWWV